MLKIIPIITFLIFIISCEKRDFKLVAKVETKAVSNILATTAKAEGEIIDIGKGITDYGHCWGLATNPTTNYSKTSFGVIGKAGIFTSNLLNLESRNLYHVRAYVKSGDEVIYGKDISFTTLGAPILTTSAATAVTSSSATVGGNVSADGGSPVTDRGVYWRASTNPDTTGTKLQIGSGTGSFSNLLNGLTPNTLYFYKAYATNSIGTTYGANLSFTTLSTVPGAPTIGTATAGNGQASVTFTAPADNGGSAITGYRATSSPGNVTANGISSPIIVTGLTNGTAYTFTVIAINATGNSLPSAASNPVTPSTLPGVPINVSATAGDTQASISFTAPGSNGGSAITGYTATSTPGGITATGAGSPIIVTGLTNGKAYTFTVVATNANGPGQASSPSNSVTPSTLLINGLVAYYPFSGNANDESGNGNNGTRTGTTTTSDRSGNLNSAYLFNGSSDFISVPASPSLNPANQITISAWVAPSNFYTGSSYGNIIISKGSDAISGHYSLAYVTDTKKFVFTIRFADEPGGAMVPSNILSTTIINLSTWYYVVGTFDGTTMKIFINGIKENQKVKNSTLPPNNEDLYIGKHPNPLYPYWVNGKIDDIRIFNRALSDQEISLFYNAK